MMPSRRRAQHAAKITVYLTDAELAALDFTVFELRRRHGVIVDRSQYVRHALASSSPSKIGALIQREERAENPCGIREKSTNHETIEASETDGPRGCANTNSGASPTIGASTDA